MNMESNNISQSRGKGPHNMAVALHACLLHVAFYVKARLCVGVRTKHPAEKLQGSQHAVEEMYVKKKTDVTIYPEMHLITLCCKRSKSKSQKSSGTRISHV